MDPAHKTLMLQFQRARARAEGDGGTSTSESSFIYSHTETDRTVCYFSLQNLTFGAFLYPDFETAIVGHFSGRLLSRGYEARVTEMGCSEAGLPILQFERQDNDSEAAYRYDPPNHYHFGDDPTLADPYESKNVEVSQCNF